MTLTDSVLPARAVAPLLRLIDGTALGFNENDTLVALLTACAFMENFAVFAELGAKLKALWQPKTWQGRITLRRTGCAHAAFADQITYSNNWDRRRLRASPSRYSAPDP
jgi:hypothetical protein